MSDIDKEIKMYHFQTRFNNKLIIIAKSHCTHVFLFIFIR